MSTPTTQITVNAVPRDYYPRWHEKYDSQIRQGDGIEVCEITDGDSVIRRSHSVTSKGTVEKHFESIEDITVDAEGNVETVKLNLTITFPKGSVTARSKARDLANGYAAALSAGRINAITDGSVNR